MSDNHNATGFQDGGENNKRLSIFLIAFFLFLSASFIFVFIIFTSFKDQVFQTKISEAENGNEIVQLRNYERNELSSFGFIDEKKGLVRIPIEEAIEKVEKLYQK